jgi:hypothetical protein
MSVFHSEGAVSPLVALSHELGLDPGLLSTESLERTFEPLRSAMLPAETVKFPPSPMAVAFLASCSRFAERPAYRIDGAWITWAECALRVGRLSGCRSHMRPARMGSW